MLHTLKSILFRVAMMAVLVSLVGAKSRADEKVLLTLQAKPGLVTRYKLVASPSFGSDAKVKVILGLLYKSEVASVSGQGLITSKTEVYDATVNDVKLPVSQVKKDFPVQNEVLALNGAEIGAVHKPDISAAAMAMFFSEMPVGKGDTWTHEYRASDLKEGIAATLTFTVADFENSSGRETVQVETSFAAKDKEKYPNAITGTIYVEKSTGDVLRSRYDFAGSMNINVYRISGNTLDDERFINRLKGLHTVKARQTLDGYYIGKENFAADDKAGGYKIDGVIYDLYKNGRFVKTTHKGGSRLLTGAYFSQTILLGTYHFDGETLELVYQDKTTEKIKLDVTVPGEPMRPLKVTIDGKLYKRDERSNSKKDNVFDRSGSVVDGITDKFDELYWE